MTIRQSKHGFWVIDGDTHLSTWAEERGRLDCDGYLLPHVLKLLKPGDTVIDVGANIGDHTIAYIRVVGDEGTVYAFEPHPDAYACLIRNCGDRPTFFRAVALEKRRQVGLNTPAHVGTSHFVEGEGGIDGFPIDELNLQRVDLIKIDVEGAEMFVLGGAEETIRRTRPIMIIEISPSHLHRFGRTPAQLYAWLEERGYIWQPVHDDVDVATSPQFDIIARPVS